MDLPACVWTIGSSMQQSRQMRIPVSAECVCVPDHGMIIQAFEMWTEHHLSSNGLPTAKKSKRDATSDQKQLQLITEWQKPDNYWQLQDPRFIIYGGSKQCYAEYSRPCPYSAVRDQARCAGRRLMAHLPIGVNSIQRQGRSILEGGRVCGIVTTWTLDGRTTSWTSKDNTAF